MTIGRWNVERIFCSTTAIMLINSENHDKARSEATKSCGFCQEAYYDHDLVSNMSYLSEELLSGLCV